MFLYSAIVLLTLLKGYEGYSLGPPMSACWDMFPAGHNVSAQPSHETGYESPFSFTLNATSYSPGDVIEVFLNSSGTWFMEGVLIQVRRVAGNVSPPAVGMFELEEDDVFLQKMNCFQLPASAVQHYSHLHIYNRTFFWKAPSAAVGHVFVRATIARNQATFWYDVRSPIIHDASINVGCDTSSATVLDTARSTTAIALLITSVIYTFLSSFKL